MRTTTEPDQRFRPDIEGLRAVAVTTVVLYHAGLARVTGGFIGVDVFFVISGFLITRQLTESITASRWRALPAFYARRIRRLLPAATVVLIATMLLWRIAGPASQPRVVAVHALFATVYGLNYRLAGEGTQYFHANTAPPALQHFWSLGVEEQFYALWPLLIVLVVVAARRRSRPVLNAMLVVVVAGSLWLSVTLSRTSPTWAFFGLHTRAWELALGALVSLTVGVWARLPAVASAVLSWAGLAAIVFAAFHYTFATSYPGIAAAVPVVGSAAVIAAGCAQSRLGAVALLRLPPMQLAGRLSYAIYLWHWPLLVIAPLALHHPLSTKSSLALVIVSVLLAAASYVVVERPARHRTWRARTWGAVAVGLAGVTALTAVVVIADPRPASGPGPAAALPASDISARGADEVTAAVARALATAQVPSNLAPDVAHAEADGPDDGSRCFLSFAATELSPCTFGDPDGTRTVVLVGDSYAEQWLPAIERVAAADHWKVVSWTKSACPLAPITYFNVFVNHTYTECDRWRAEVIARIHALAPQLVIASQNVQFLTGVATEDALADGTVTTLRALAGATTKVAFVDPPPAASMDVPLCVSWHFASIHACDVTVRGGEALTPVVAAIGARVQAAGYPVIDPSSLMCALACPVVVGNVVGYRDAGHVTATYARFLAPLFAGIMGPRPAL